jgi:hypothetical protein
VPPDIASPPVSTRVEPTCTHTGVTPALGSHLAVTVPPEQTGPGGVVVAPTDRTIVVRVEAGGRVESAAVDGEEHPATHSPVATARTGRQLTMAAP